MGPSRKLLFWSLLILLFYLPLVLLVAAVGQRALAGILVAILERMPADARRDVYARLTVHEIFGREVVAYAMQRLSAEEKEALYERLSDDVAGWYDVLPEPDVGRIGQRRRQVEDRLAELRLNNAGLRSSSDFSAKAGDVFRIVCLGDSVVFGVGGREQDRFCDQIESFYSHHNITASEKRIETYAVGVPGWTAVNEATYLGSRISEYDPDLVIVLTLPNDITDAMGVTGTGAATTGFSPEVRDRGSATFSQRGLFGIGIRGSALWTDLSPQGRRRWDKAMRRMARLEQLQRRRERHMLFSVLGSNTYFNAIFRDYHRRLGLTSPVICTDYRFGPETRLPHDSHPSRLGHSILADHYVIELSRLGFVHVPEDVLPHLHPGLEARGVSAELTLDQFRSRYGDRHLKTRIDFSALEGEDAHWYLGGFFLDRMAQLPFASVHSAFLLQRPQVPSRLVVEIDVPDRDELFPFALTLYLDGAQAAALRLGETEAGRHRIEAVIPGVDTPSPALEVALETSSYWTEIEDPRMKSFYLVSAEIVPQ